MPTLSQVPFCENKGTTVLVKYCIYHASTECRRHHRIRNGFGELLEICPEMDVNAIHTLYDRHHEVSPSPNPHLNASNSVKYEVTGIWKLQIIMSNMKYPRSMLRAFLKWETVATGILY